MGPQPDIIGETAAATGTRGHHWSHRQAVTAGQRRQHGLWRTRQHCGRQHAGRSLHLVCGTGGSFGSSSLQQEIGLGDATAVQRVVVRWPGSGTVQEFAVPKIDRVYSAVEGEPNLTEVAVKTVKLGGGERPSPKEPAATR